MAISVPHAGSASGPGASAFSIAKLAGTFAFRFSGFTMENAILYRLAGIGQFQLDDQGNLSGAHRSSITAMQGQGASLRKGVYDLEGRVTIDDKGIGSALIRFKTSDGKGQDLDGEFYVVVAGTTDRLWFVSSGAKLVKSGRVANELVDLEAVRITQT